MKTTSFAILSFVLVYGTASYADTFGTDPNTTFDLEFVTIGNPGNADDRTGSPNPAGSVPYNYRIGKYEISKDMIDKANTLGGLGLTHNGRGTNKPATSISWFDAAKFVNWLNTSEGHLPAYKFDGSGNFQVWRSSDVGYNPNNLFRNSQAKYVLPSVHEWYKAAFYDPMASVYYKYPTASDTIPTHVASGTQAGTAVYAHGGGPADITLAGGLSPYGTMAQGGNVWEWEETDSDLVNDSDSAGLPPRRGLRGGYWSIHLFRILSSSNRNNPDPRDAGVSLGFRVASVDPIPEPTTCALALAALCLAMGRRRAF